MPTYTFKCQSCGEKFDKLLKLVDYENPQTCSCGGSAERIICAPAIRPDYGGYSCPISGQWVEGRKAHAENIARHGCRVLEPGEKEASIRTTQQSEAQFERELDATTDKLLADLPARKMEKLIGEIEGGLTATVVRQ